MRDFRRDVSSAAEWTSSAPAGEPSWSLARQRLFDSCQRAYCLCHFISQGGWDQHSHPLARQCYIEKRLLKASEWAETVLNASLRDALERTLRFPDGKRESETQRLFQFEAARRVAEGAAQLRNREWESDPKCLNLFELYYADGEPGAFERAASAIRKAAKAFSVSDAMLGLLSVERAAWRRLNEFESFRLPNLELWARPPLCWVEEGQANFLELRLSFPDVESSSLEAGLLDLLAFHKFKKPTNSSIVSIVSPEGGCMNAAPDALAIRALAPKGAAAMAAKIRLDGRAWLEDFPKAADESLCASCRFKGVCKAV